MKKSREKEWAILVEGVTEAWEELQAAADALNEKLEQDSKAPEDDPSIGTKEESDAFKDAWKEYVYALEECQSFAENEAATAEEYFDERSEKWQESEKGEAWTAYKESWEAVRDIEIPKMEDHVDDDTGTVELPDDEVDGPISEALTEVES
jgi:hypothetical protein